jgi:hypothetical protein
MRTVTRRRTEAAWKLKKAGMAAGLRSLDAVEP